MARDKDIEVAPGVYARRGRRKKHLQVVHTLFDSNIRDVPKSLRKLAKLIEAGEYGDVQEAVVVLEGKEVTVHGYGPQSSGPTAMLLLDLGKYFMTKNTWDFKHEDSDT